MDGFTFNLLLLFLTSPSTFRSRRSFFFFLSREHTSRRTRKSQIHTRDSANAAVAVKDLRTDMSFVLSGLSLIQHLFDLPKQNKNPKVVLN